MTPVATASVAGTVCPCRSPESLRMSATNPDSMSQTTGSKEAICLPVTSALLKIQSFQVCRFRVCCYSEGIASHSPAVASEASYPGETVQPRDVPHRGSVIGDSRRTQPFQGRSDVVRSPRVARLRGQPWAMRRNSFGVKTRPFDPKLGTTRRRERKAEINPRSPKRWQWNPAAWSPRTAH